jgi:hypothetical protein
MSSLTLSAHALSLQSHIRLLEAFHLGNGFTGSAALLLAACEGEKRHGGHKRDRQLVHQISP